MTSDERETDQQLLYVIMQPTRSKIISALRDGIAKYIEEIAKEIEESPRNVSFHLTTLAEYGLVEGEYREIKAPTPNPGLGKAAKYYTLTPKYKETVRRLLKGLQ